MPGNDSEGPTTRSGQLFELYEWLGWRIAGQLPEMLAIQQQLFDAIWPMSEAAIGGSEGADATRRARARIAAQGANDFFDLLYEAKHNGRNLLAALTLTDVAPAPAIVAAA